MINRYGEEEGGKKREEGRISTITRMLQTRDHAVGGGGEVGRGGPTRGRRKRDGATGKEIQCYRDKYGRYGKRKLAYWVLIFTKRMTASVASAVGMNLLSVTALSSPASLFAFKTCFFLNSLKCSPG